MRCGLEPYDFYNPIFYTEKQADDISIAMHGVLVDRKSISSLVSNRTSFLRKLKRIAVDDKQAHYLSFKRVANGRFSLHLDPYAGYVNLGKFEVDPDLATAVYLKDDDAFQHFAFEEVENRFHLALEKVAQNKYKYDARVADEYIRKRFDLKNFPEVEILTNVKLDAKAYEFLKSAKKYLSAILSRPGYSTREAFISASMNFDDYYAFASDIEVLYLDYLDAREEQVAFFEMSFMVDDDEQNEGRAFLTKTELLISDREVSPKTPSSVFCIRTDDEVASEYEYAVHTGTTSMMQRRFIDMFIAVAMNLITNFDRNCILAEDFAHSEAKKP